MQIFKFLKNIFELPENEALENEVKTKFYTAQEKLLYESKSYLAENHLNNYITKLKQRESQGLRPPVNNGIELETYTRRENTATCILATVEYFNKNYPEYRYVLLNQVDDFCKQYGLICGDIKNYKGTIPEDIKNKIQNFKSLEDDKVYYTNTFPDRNIQHIIDPTFKILDKIKFFEEREAAQNKDIFFEEFPAQICARIEDVIIKNDHPGRVFRNGQWSTESYSSYYKNIIQKFDTNVRAKFLPEPIILKPFFKLQTYGFLILGSWYPSDRSSE